MRAPAALMQQRRRAEAPGPLLVPLLCCLGGHGVAVGVVVQYGCVMMGDVHAIAVVC